MPCAKVSPRSKALGVTMFTEAPIAWWSISGVTAFTTSMRLMRSAGTASIAAPRVPDSVEPTDTPLTVMLFSAASMPRTTM